MIGKLAKGEEIKTGPQTHRKNSEGPMGRTTLKEKCNCFYDRDFQKAKIEWEASKKKK